MSALTMFAVITPLVILAVAVTYLIVVGRHPVNSRMHIVRLTNRDGNWWPGHIQPVSYASWRERECE